MPYVINYAATMMLAALAGHPLLSLALRIMATTPMFIMIGEFAALSRIMMNNHLKID